MREFDESSPVDRLFGDVTRADFLRRAAGAAAIPALLGPLAPLARAAGAGAVAVPSTINWGFSGGALTRLDNYFLGGAGTPSAIRLGVEGLVCFAPTKQLKIIGQLATSWKETPDAIVFQLRRGVRFWDGTPFTADDVVASLNRHTTSASRQFGVFRNVQEVRATGQYEVTIALKAHDPVLLERLPFAGLIYSKASLDKAGDKSGSYGDNPVMGTGPYVINSFSSSGISGTRNESYWGTKPIAKQLNLRFVDDINTEMLAIQGGQLHGAWEVPYEQSARVAQYANVQWAPGHEFFAFVYRVDKAPFDDVHVRKAIAHCIPRTAMTKAFLAGHGAVSAHSLPVPKESFQLLGATKAQADKFYRSLPTYTFDLKRAAAELKQSKVPNGFSYEVIASSADSPVLVKAVLGVAANAKKIGINLTVKDVPLPELFAASGQAPMQVLHAFIPVASPTFLLGQSGVYSNVAGKPAGFNLSSYVSPQIEQLQQQAQDAASDKARLGPLMQIARIAANDLPVDTFFFPDSAVATAKSLRYDGFSAFSWNGQNWPTQIKAA